MKKLLLVGAMALTLALGLMVQNTNAQSTELQFTITEWTNTCTWDEASYSLGSYAVQAASWSTGADGLGYGCELYANAAVTITLWDADLSGAVYTFAASNLTGDASGLIFSEDGSLTAGSSWTTADSQMTSQELYVKNIGEIGNIAQDFDIDLTVPAGQPADVYTADLTITLS